MVVRSLKTIKPKVWIPPIYSANFKVTVERTDGTIDDITDILISLKIEDGVTEGIGNFEFEIPNPNETYSNVWNGMEIFRYYCDYASGTPTTLRFRGRVEKPSKRNNNVLVTGRSEALFVHGQDIHKDYTDIDVGVIIKDLFDTYGEDRYDTSEIDTSTGTTVTMTFLDLPFWDAIEAVCIASSYDCYVSCDLVVEFFASGSRESTTEGIVHDYNLIEVGDFAPDLSVIKNQIRVIGGTIDGVQVIYTANDTAANQSTYGIRREIINDDGITTYAAAKELADFVLADRKDPPTIGDVKGLLLATIQPGEKIRLSSPLENLQPGSYNIISYVHEISEEGLFTIIKINKESKRISHVLKERIQREHKRTDSSSNVDDLDYSEIELFNADVGTHESTPKTEIVDGVLKLKTGESSGFWISPTYGPDDNRIFESIKIDIVGDNLPGATIGVSYDGGINYQTINRGSLITAGIGDTVIIKLTLSTNTQIDSLVVQYSMTT